MSISFQVFKRFLLVLTASLVLIAAQAMAQPSVPSPRAQAVFDFWTAERRAAVQPRDLVIDQRGLGYLRHGDGSLEPYGHNIAAEKQPVANKGKPTNSGNGGNTDGGGGGGKTKTVRNAEWTNGGTVQTAAGRILFAMGSSYYVCSGTVVNDGTSGRSIILTAAHCVYDDENKAFATNIMFIPDQADTNGSGTDFNCDNDPLGCWAPSYGVVDSNWTAAVFPNNIPWDYAYYVVSDSGAHSGTGGDGVLDSAALAMDISFAAATLGRYNHALGYSYSDDPNFMYCAQDMGMEGYYGDYWLSSCSLSGGSSGGLWTQATTNDLGTGPVISVNSWGYTGQPGMGGPSLSGNSAECLFSEAKTVSANTTGCH